MKRRLTALCGLLLALMLAACGSGGENSQAADSSARSAESGGQAAASAESGGQAAASAETGEQAAASAESGAAVRHIQITAEEGSTIVFALNDSAAADDLFRQLPLTVAVENYGSDEKIFYPPEKLDTGGAPPAQGPAGTLAYYEPWGNVAMFYGECGGADGLFELGEAVSGAEPLSGIAGEIQIAAAGPPSAPPKPVESESAASLRQTGASLPAADGGDAKERAAMKINVQIGDRTFPATLEENAAADSLIGLMESAPVVISMSDYAGFEKVGDLGRSLPADDRRTTTQSGDIVLYNGNQIVIFYGSNSWSYTRLGKLDDVSGWEEALGSGGVTVTFTLA